MWNNLTDNKANEKKRGNNPLEETQQQCIRGKKD